jgi:hypothetical protein
MRRKACKGTETEFRRTLERHHLYMNDLWGKEPPELFRFLSQDLKKIKIYIIVFDENEYYGAEEPPVRWWRSHLSGLSEPPRLLAIFCS